MLKVLRQGQRWIMGFVVLVVGGVFVAFVGVGGPLFKGSSGDAIVDVDGYRYGASDFLRLRARQEDAAKQRFGENFDLRLLGEQIDLMTANTLVQGAILTREAERLGLRVTNEEIVDLIKQLPDFKDEQGRFRPEAVKGYVEYEYGTERRFLESVRRQLLAQKAAKLIADTASVSETEARDALEREEEQVEIAYVALDTTDAGPQILISDEQVDDLLAKDAGRIKDFYDAHPERFNAPEKVRARHILLRTAPDATEEQIEEVRKRAVALRDRVQSGEDFATVALENSEDPGSKVKGGDLGFFQRGQMVPTFEDVAFAMEPGAISDVVKTDFGFHVIQVEEKKPAESRSLEEAKREIAHDLLKADASLKAARERADALVERIRGGRSLEEAARADALTLERPPPLRRQPDGQIPGLGADPDVLAAAFRLTPERASSDRVFQVGDKLVLIQLLKRSEPSAEDVAAKLPAARERLLEDERNRVQGAWLETQREALMAAGKLKVDLKALERR